MAFLQKALPFQAMGEGSPQAPPPFQSLFPALFLSASKPADFGGWEGSLCSGVSEVPQGGPEAPAWLPPAPWSIWNLQLSASALRGIQSPLQGFPPDRVYFQRGLCFPFQPGPDGTGAAAGAGAGRAVGQHLPTNPRERDKDWGKWSINSWQSYFSWDIGFLVPVPNWV